MNFSKTKSCNKDFSPIGKRNKWKKLWINIKRSKAIYLMLLPVMAFYIIFSYVPLPGIVLAWKDDYLHKLGLFGGEWVGWQWFEEFFIIAAAISAIVYYLIKFRSNFLPFIAFQHCKMRAICSKYPTIMKCPYQFYVFFLDIFY